MYKTKWNFDETRVLYERLGWENERCLPFNDTSRHKHRSIFLGIQ